MQRLWNRVPSAGLVQGKIRVKVDMQWIAFQGGVLSPRSACYYLKAAWWGVLIQMETAAWGEGGDNPFSQHHFPTGNSTHSPPLLCLGSGCLLLFGKRYLVGMCSWWEWVLGKGVNPFLPTHFSPQFESLLCASQQLLLIKEKALLGLSMALWKAISCMSILVLGFSFGSLMLTAFLHRPEHSGAAVI